MSQNNDVPLSKSGLSKSIVAKLKTIPLGPSENRNFIITVGRLKGALDPHGQINYKDILRIKIWGGSQERMDQDIARVMETFPEVKALRYHVNLGTAEIKFPIESVNPHRQPI